MSGNADGVHLVEQLDAADADVRREAAFALAEAGDQRALKPLLNTLSSNVEPDEARVHAAQALGRLGAPALQELLKRLPDDALDKAWQGRDRSKRPWEAAEEIDWKTPDLAVRALGMIAEVDPALRQQIASVLIEVVRSDRVGYALSAFDVLSAIARRDQSLRERIVSSLVELLYTGLTAFDTDRNDLGLKPVTNILSVYYLGEIGSRSAVPVLLELLEVRDVRIAGRRVLVEALGKIGDPSAAVALARELPTAIDFETINYMPLSVRGFPRLPALEAAWMKLDIVWEDEAQVRQSIFPFPSGIVRGYVVTFHADRVAIAKAFINIGGSSAIAPLAELLQYTAPQPGDTPADAARAKYNTKEVRAAAAQMLMRIDSSEALAVLRAALADPLDTVRLGAASILDKSDPLVLPTLLELVESTDADVRTQAIRALGAMSGLREALAQGSHELRLTVAKALAASGYAEGASTLLELMLSNTTLAYSAAETLEKTQAERIDPAWTPTFLEALKHRNYHVRGCAASVLGRMGNPDMVCPLIEALDALGDSSAWWQVSEKIVGALERIGTPEALAALEERRSTIEKRRPLWL